MSRSIVQRALGSGLLSLVVALSLGAAPCRAQGYPSKPIRIVVSYGPGSGTDIGTRLLVPMVSAGLGQPIVIENKAGANGAIGAQAVAHAAPDGYTFLMGNNSTHGGNLAVLKEPGYDPVKDFVPVALVGIYPSFLVVHPSLPVKTPAELVAYARANPGKLTYASGSVSSIANAEAFKKELGLDILRVPYQSNPQGLTDVIAGRVSMMFPDISSSLPHVKAGTLRALAVTSLGERSALAPDVPTVNENIMPNFHYVGWIGLFAPAGTPPAIVERMASEVLKAAQQPEFRQKMAQLGAEARPMGPAEFEKFVAAEMIRLPRLLREAGVRPE